MSVPLQRHDDAKMVRNGSAVNARVIAQPATNPAARQHQSEDAVYDEATALQILNETAFVTPALQPHLHQSSTLIPSPLAKLITTTTGLGTFAIRSYARAFEWGLGLGKETTLRSLELTRAGIEVVLKASAKDVTDRSTNNSDLARTDTESVLARSISALHWAFIGATFATSAGFNITSTYLQGLELTALQGLGTLNAILGDTESSRAVSAIITLIKEELTRPGGEDGLVPGYWDLIVGCAGFVILQRWGRRKTALEFRGNGGEETIWDLVVDDRGFRADVVGTKRDGGDEVTATQNLTGPNRFVNGKEGQLFEQNMDLEISPTITLSTQDQTNLSDEEIRNRILAQLPPGTKAVITSNTLTLKTVQVDIHGSATAYIEAPPGLTMISEQLGTDDNDAERPHQTIVFRSSLKRNTSSEINPVERLMMSNADQEYPDNGDFEENGLTMSSPKRRRSVSNGAIHLGFDRLNIDKPLPKMPETTEGPVANQKKSRRPALPVSFTNGSQLSRQSNSTGISKKSSKAEKAGIIKKALQSLSPRQSLSGVDGKPGQPPYPATWKTDPSSSDIGPLSSLTGNREVSTKRIYPMPESSHRSPLYSPDRSPTRSYFTMHEKKRESTFSQTDSFSLHSTDSRPASPTSFRTHHRADTALNKTQSHTEMSLHSAPQAEQEENGSTRHHYRSRSFVPSLYSMGTKDSDEAIILQPKTPMQRSMFEDHKMLTALATDGKVPGMFPDRHLVKSIRRFARFASASYGSNFLRFMGIANMESPPSASKELVTQDIHHEHSSFATHTGLPADTILLSSFCDPKGGPVTVKKNQPTMMPLMHFVSIDHDSKAVVLTCRGTWGFEDVLTDMTCDYDNIYWQGQMYQVHQGVHASARRMLDGGGRRVMSTIRAALEDFPDYGLVLCGHSLGGSVAAVLGLLISEPNRKRRSSYFSSGPHGDNGPSFVTAHQQKQLTDKGSTASAPPVDLPPGRPVHVFAYGPPATVSPGLRLATRGLITTIINHNDVVPTLSLGTLQDFKAVAIHLKHDPSSPLVRVKSAMMERVKHAVLGNFWNRESTPPVPIPSSGISAGGNDEEWQWTALASLRDLMINDKLLPPGEVFVIETSRVFDRVEAESDQSNKSSATDGAYRPLGRAATRVQFKLIRNVESRFREIRFGSGMFGDHSPGRYEGGLGALDKGIFEEI